MKKCKYIFAVLVACVVSFLCCFSNTAYAYDYSFLEAFNAVDTHDEALDYLQSYWRNGSDTSYYGVEMSRDELEEMCASLNEAGFPCYIRYVSDFLYAGACYVIVGNGIVHVDSFLNLGANYADLSGKYHTNSIGRPYYSQLEENSNSILELIADRLQYTTSDGTTYSVAKLLNTISNRITEVRDKLSSVDTKLGTIAGHVDGLENTLSTIGNRLLVTDSGVTYTISELVRNLWNAQQSANDKLGTIAGHVDGLENTLSTIGNRLLVTDSGVTYTVSELVRNLWTAQLTANDRLGTLAGYVDQVEGRLLRTVDDVQYTVADTTYHAWQQLKTLTGYVDGLEASSLTANNLLRDLVGNVDGVESTLSSVLHWLQVDAYGDQDVYAIMSGMVYNFVYGNQSQQTVIQSVWDKYWLTEDQMLAATFRVQLSADDLRDMQRRFNEAGIPTEVRYLEDAGIYVLRSAGNARAVDFDDFSQNQSQATGLNTYPRFFSNAGCLYYAAEAGSSTSLHNLNSKMGTVIQRLDTLIANQGQNLEADITVDLGDITISSDDTTLTAYIKMLAYGQQNMYSSLAAIAAEYRDASASDKAAMDNILLNYWYTPGSNIGQVYFPGDQLRSIHQHMVEIGYPCLVVWDSSLEAYVIKLTGNPRVSDVFDFSYTGAYSGKQDLYQDGVVYYLTQGGYLLSSRNDGTEASIDAFSSEVELLGLDILSNQNALLEALDAFNGDLVEVWLGESMRDDGTWLQLDVLTELVDTKTTGIETTLSTVGANIVTAIEDASAVCPHEYTSQVVVEPSCELPGVMKYTCGLCSAFYYEDVAALGHAWSGAAGGAAEPVLQEEVVLPLSTMPVNYEFSVEGFPAPVPGDLYRVCIDGQDYFVRMYAMYSDGLLTFITGDIGLMLAQFGVDIPSTGEPFFYAYADGITNLMVLGDEGSMVEISVSHILEPSTNVVVEREEAVVPVQSVKGWYGGYEVSPSSLEFGGLYRVVIDDQEYFSRLFSINSDSRSDAVVGYLGNGSVLANVDWLFGLPDTGEPFAFVFGLSGTDENASVSVVPGTEENPVDFGVYHVLEYSYPSPDGNTSTSIRTCTRCHAGEDMAALVSFLDAKLSVGTDLTPLITRMDTIISHLEANIGAGGCEHVYVSEINQEQTCVLPGLQTFTCELCGSSYSEILASLGHDWKCTGRVEDELDPETGEVLTSGYDIYTCSVCGDTYNDYAGSGAPAAESDSIAGLIGRVFEKLGGLAGELLASVIRMMDKLLTGFDQIVTDFNEKTQQIVSFGAGYPAWLAGAWEIMPSELQLAMSFCLVVFCLGVIGKKLVFIS